MIRKKSDKTKNEPRALTSNHTTYVFDIIYLYISTLKYALNLSAQYFPNRNSMDTFQIIEILRIIDIDIFIYLNIK